MEYYADETDDYADKTPDYAEISKINKTVSLAFSMYKTTLKRATPNFSPL